MPLNCRTCGAPLKGDEEHCPYCGSFIEYEDRPKKQKPEHEHKNLPQIKYASEIFVIIISIFTFGLYGIYWYSSRRKSFNNLVEGLKFPDIGLVIYIIGWLMFFFFLGLLKLILIAPEIFRPNLCLKVLTEAIF